LLPDTVAETAEQIAERVRVAIGNETSALPEAVTVSVGVAAVEGSNTPMELAVVLALADQALYEAKVQGRNTVRVRQPVAPDSIVIEPVARDLGPGRAPR
jgi:diguanylate cyclase (GGDEF)-like protein